MPTSDVDVSAEVFATSAAVSLENRYEAERGRHWISGIPAIVRFLVDQMREDRRRGWNTATFVSGYPGSPLGSLDSELIKRSALLRELGILHQPGLNEELAATAVFGSQVASVTDGFRHDGVLGVWYGKSPGLDRSADALRHGNFAGTGPRSGAIVLVGDDPGCESSTLPSSSEALCADLSLPVLHPGNVQDILDLGRHAIALSRYSGLWSALKLVSSVADGSGVVELDVDQTPCRTPQTDGPRHRVGNVLNQLHTKDLERDIAETRVPRALEYAVLNGLNNVTFDAPDAWLGIVASGHTYFDVVDAFRLLGITEEGISALGVRLLRLRMPHPLDRNELRSFARGLDEIFVVEERRPFVEAQLRDALYGMPDPPTITGKHEPEGVRLLPSWGSLDGASIAMPLATRLETRVDASRLDLRRIGRPKRISIPLSEERAPWFCSGCPHSSSTRVPEGALVGAGIGCHALAARMPAERTGTVLSNSQMGGEGSQWVGAAPFVDTPHIFQNMGDGTLAHSGWLSIRFAVAARSHITFKILYNGAVAMTGGQPTLGHDGVPNLIRGLKAEGVGRVIVTTDDTKRYRRVRLGAGVEVWDRRKLLEAQTTLAAEPGVTVLIHDQGCAAELRRARTRGRAPTPSERVVINERVCEGCGDCGAKSGCLSLHTTDTPFGLKTQVHQTSCNFDYSCLAGDCPSFTLVAERHQRLRWLRRTSGSRNAFVMSDVPDPPQPIRPTVSDQFVVRMPGVGGTGIVTVAQVLAMAASLDGLDVHGLDQTGLSQKAGPVVSDLRITRRGGGARPGRASGPIDLFLVFDAVVALSADNTSMLEADRTVIVGSTTWAPTGPMVGNPDAVPLDIARAQEQLGALVKASSWVDSAALAEELLGKSTSANLLLVGVAYQLGAVPIGSDSIEEAIRQNGVAVDANLAAFRRGRAIAHDEAETGADEGAIARPTQSRGLGTAARSRIHDSFEHTGAAERIMDLATELCAYQNERYAERYVSILERVAKSSSPKFLGIVVDNLFKLMAYKDEYEVARLHLLPEMQQDRTRPSGAAVRGTILLHPPVLRALGLRRKLRFGPWSAPLLRVLRAGRRVRGTRLDPFGYAHVRRIERELIAEYIALIEGVCDRYEAVDPDVAAEIADLPRLIRGYEAVKLASVGRYHDRLAELRRNVIAPVSPAEGSVPQ